MPSRPNAASESEAKISEARGGSVKPLKLWEIACLVAAAWLIFGGPKGCDFNPLDVITTTPGDSLVVILYEADHGPLPPYALGAANELTAAGREVRPTDDDVLNGLGEVPTWLKPALEPGRNLMGSEQRDDALVVLNGGRLVKATKLPPTREAILEYVK